VQILIAAPRDPADHLLDSSSAATNLADLDPRLDLYDPRFASGDETARIFSLHARRRRS